MAPVKALCSERHDDWSMKFGSLGVTCKELTGDSDINDIYELSNVHLIFTTPVSVTPHIYYYCKCDTSYLLHLISANVTAYIYWILPCSLCYYIYHATNCSVVSDTYVVISQQ